MTTRVAVINQKGGVGKTAVTLGLVSAARAAGKRSLVVDLDPQGSATWSLGVEITPDTPDIGAALVANREGAAGGAVTATDWGDGVDVVPAQPDLVHRETDVARKDPERRLVRALSSVDTAYDYTFIDCAPSLGLNTTNALVAADRALIVVELAAHSLRGLNAVIDAIDEVWTAHNSNLDIAGVIVNKAPPVSTEADRRHEELGSLVGKRSVWKPAVPHRVIVNEALGMCRPIHELGYRARDVIDAFDQLFVRLERS